MHDSWARSAQVARCSSLRGVQSGVTGQLSLTSTTVGTNVFRRVGRWTCTCPSVKWQVRSWDSPNILAFLGRPAVAFGLSCKAIAAFKEVFADY